MPLGNFVIHHIYFWLNHGFSFHSKERSVTHWSCFHILFLLCWAHYRNYWIVLLIFPRSRDIFISFLFLFANQEFSIIFFSGLLNLPPFVIKPFSDLFSYHLLFYHVWPPATSFAHYFSYLFPWVHSDVPLLFCVISKATQHLRVRYYWKLFWVILLILLFSSYTFIPI